MKRLWAGEKRLNELNKFWIEDIDKTPRISLLVQVLALALPEMNNGTYSWSSLETGSYADILARPFYLRKPLSLGIAPFADT